MLCACSGEQFKFEDAPESPVSLATRDFSASGPSSRARDWDSKLEDSQVDEAESTLKEALSLNYEEARALLGRLEYQRGNFDAALQVFHGIDIRALTPRITKAIAERIQQQNPRPKGDSLLLGSGMSMHSVSLLLEAILLKSKSLEKLGKSTEAARECKIILDTVETALPNGMPEDTGEYCKLQEILHKALELLPKLWIRAGLLGESITAYRRALVKPWNLDPQRLAHVQKDLASILLYGGFQASLPEQWAVAGPKDNTEEAILLLFILMSKIAYQEIGWDPEIMDHLSFALTISGHFEQLADHVEQALPGFYDRAERWYILALCYSAADQKEAALNLLKKILNCSKATQNPHLPSLLFGAKLCSTDVKHAHEGVNFARKVIDLARDKHFMNRAYMLLGICYGCSARTSISDSERAEFHRKSLSYLNNATLIDNGKYDPEIIFNLGMENAIQRNIDAAFHYVMMYSDMVAESSGRGWKLLPLIMSAEKQFEDAEAIVDIALDQVGVVDRFELLRLRAVLQIAREQPQQAMETYRTLLAQIQVQREEFHARNCEVVSNRNLEIEAWQDLASIYTKLELWQDAEFCVDKVKLMQFYSPRNWHATGMLLEAQSLYKEALVSFSFALSIEPDFVPSMVSTAAVLIKLGNQLFPIARGFLMNALKLEPTNHEAWFKLGQVSKMEGLFQQAADFFQAAHELNESAPIRSFV